MITTKPGINRSIEKPVVRAPQAADWALSHGLGSLTTFEVADLLGTTTAQVPQRLASAIKRGEWVMPARSLWIPVPPEYRVWGGPPAIEFIDAMMAHMSVDYYIGWLSAAAIHGAGHHAPQVSQVAVERMIRGRTIGRVRFEFYVRTNIGALPCIRHTVRSGFAKVSSPEVTALDLCADVAISGGIDNVATVLIDLVDAYELSTQRILELSELYNPAAIRRFGWLLENFTDTAESKELRMIANRCVKTPSLLDPLNKPGGRIDRRWMIRINTEVEVEE